MKNILDEIKIKAKALQKNIAKRKKQQQELEKKKVLKEKQRGQD